MVTICTTSLTFNNSTFCPHSVFIYFVRISEQTAIISLYTINWPFCINETVCVYCAVPSGSLYTGCPGRNVPDFGRMFLKLKYTDITKNTYIRSWTVTEIMAGEKCGLLAVPPTLPGSRDVLPVHCACPSCSLQTAQARPCCDCTCKVLGTLRTTATLVRVFM